ncbi:glycosyltransferase [Streptomyces sp. NPDC001780]
MRSQRHCPTGLFTALHLVQPVDGGVARVVLDLVAAQVAEGFRAVVACPVEGPLAGAAAERGAEVHAWRATRDPNLRLFHEIRDVARLVERVRPDVVHAHSAKAGFAGRLAVRGRVPTVFQPHAWSFEAVGGTTERLVTRWERLAVRWTDRVICVSEAERSTGERAGVHAPWTVIHNGVDVRRFAAPESARGNAESADGARTDVVNTDADADAVRAGAPHAHVLGAGAVRTDPDAPDKPFSTGGPDGSDGSDDPGGSGSSHQAAGIAAARASLPLLSALAPDTPVVVCVGRLCRQKGQDVLLNAWPRVVRQLPRARLVLVGDGPDARALSAAAPPSVLFAGAVRDPAPWYRAADLVVLPSRWEGMALAPLEAMASGRPVVLSDVDGARESLPAGHEPFCLAPPEDPTALATAIGTLLQDGDLRVALGRQGHQHVLSTYDVRRTTRAVSDVYRQVTAVTRPDRREPTPR